MFREWLACETKFHTYGSMTCGHCGTKLFPYRIVPNDKHVYRYGQMFECDCKKSKVWTNSIRSTDELLACFAGERDKYRHGFCNDTYCGHCFNYLYPLQNGFVYQGVRTDRYGCEKCEGNQAVVVIAERKDDEIQGSQSLYKKYQRREQHLKDVLKSDEVN